MQRLASLCSGVAQAALALLLVLIVVEIVARSAFGVSTLIADEYGGYLFVALTYLGIVPAFVRGQLLRVELVVVRLPERRKRALELCALVLGAVVLAVLAYQAGSTAYASFAYGVRSSQASGTPLYIPQAFMFLGLALLAFAFVMRAVHVGCQRPIVSAIR